MAYVLAEVKSPKPCQDSAMPRYVPAREKHESEMARRKLRVSKLAHACHEGKQGQPAFEACLTGKLTFWKKCLKRPRKCSGSARSKYPDSPSERNRGIIMEERPSRANRDWQTKEKRICFGLLKKTGLTRYALGTASPSR